jgi:LuxR family maltose regulon positive regulatory protein
MADDSVPLLETKFHAPRRRPGLVARPRLLERVRGHGRPALTLVSAPAGFGKTTFVSDWLATSTDGTAVAWVLLDRLDNDPARFWSYVVAALQTVAPDVGVAALPMLQSSETSTDAAVATLLNELNAVAGELVVVLDDYHVIEAAEIQAAMTFIVEHLPPPVRLVVTSRADPPWPLATLRARGDLREVRATDLRFSVDEAATYLNETMGLTLDADDVRAIEDRTEGWIAALQLAALSMQGRDDVSGFIASFAGDDRYIVDYLVGEVLLRQTDHDRSFLLHTSILSRLTAPLCDVVTGRDCAQATLERLDRTNLFLVPLDDRRAWYRYHHLFADVLRARLLDEQPEIIPELHRRASAWYEGHGDRPEAIAHALAGEDFARAADLIEAAAPTMRRTRQEATLRGWLELVPEALVRDRPVLAMTLVGARMATGDDTGVEALLQGVERWLEAPGGADRPPEPPTAFVVDEAELARLPAQVAVHRAGLELLAGDLVATVDHANRVLAVVEPSDHLSLGSANALLGLASWTAGDLETARVAYEAAVRHLVDADHLPDALGCSLALADIQLAQGRLHDAAATLERGLEHARGHPARRGTADMHVALSEVQLEHGDLEAARRHLEESAALGEGAALPQHAYRWRAAQARLREVEGDLPGALALLDAAEGVSTIDYSPAVRPIAARRARIRIAQGDIDAALRWATDRGLGPHDELGYVREYEHITLARTLLAEHASGRGRRALEDALGLLTRLLAAAVDGERGGTAIEILVLLALAHHAHGDHAAAAATLRDALTRAEPEGYVRVFADEGPPLAALLRSHQADDAAGHHARRLLDVAPTDDSPTRTAPATAPGGLVDPLSSRELDVLRLLRSDLSGPDIARELFVSLNTLRTHTKSIYTKLGVNNRRAAVRRADELGI